MFIVPNDGGIAKFVALLHATMPQVRGDAVGSIGSSAATFYLFILALLLIGLVVAPAVWSRRPARRKAATGVLDLLLRFLRRGPR
jgi:hypothetical protein